ncbi:MAG: rhomboid family intramembrane serine protease [Clostridiales Family XIII bacterium]|jgi:rhomboid protease GluP|nr:rhomboid family intramembrane serine protease [Clostridiales Family XIII bacterium]
MKNDIDRQGFLNTSPKKYFGTITLVLLCLILYGVERLLGWPGDPGVLLEMGARYNPEIIGGAYWRFIVPVFLHDDLTHIVMNMISLFWAGCIAESIYGHVKFLLIFFVSGLSGNIFSFAFLPEAYSVGASTAVFGLFGACLLLIMTYNGRLITGASRIIFYILIAINVFFVTVPERGIDTMGHVGGLIGGILCAAIFTPHDSAVKVNAIFKAVIGLVLLLMWVYLIRKGWMIH